MNFTLIEFFAFFFLVFVASWMAPTRRFRHGVLLAASYYFYAYWDYRFCGLLVFSTLVDFVLSNQLSKATSIRGRRLLLLASVVVNLGVLGFFKYANFFVDSAAPIVRSLGLSSDSLSIVLPVGISFFTFQTMSYTIDVYRRRIEPVRSLLDFSVYVAFFPQLVAGPIVRASELMPQLANAPSWSSRRFHGGAMLFLRGAVKKVLIADRLGEMVDVVFAGPDLYSGATIALAVLAYTGQIYGDFSGYTDMAIGVAKMLGYRFPRNFRHPYLATSPAEFWHRWHMTLSRWLRDYLYIPMGGNRGGGFATYRNLMLTMTLGGLWHGAAWTFVFWGAWHGVALSIHRASRSWAAKFPSIARVTLGWMSTFSAVLVGWVFFRAQSFESAVTILSRIALFADGIAWYPPLPLLAIGCLVAEHMAYRTRLRRWMAMPMGSWFTPIAATVMLWCLVLYAPQGFRPFVYFQF